MPSDLSELITSLLPLIIMSVAFAFGNYFLAGRLGKSMVLWIILSLIPGVNFFFFIYICYVVVIRILDQLAKITARLNA